MRFMKKVKNLKSIDKYTDLMFEAINYYQKGQLTKPQVEILLGLMMQKQATEFMKDEISGLIEWGIKNSILPNNKKLNLNN